MICEIHGIIFIGYMLYGIKKVYVGTIISIIQYIFDEWRFIHSH